MAYINIKMLLWQYVCFTRVALLDSSIAGGVRANTTDKIDIEDLLKGIQNFYWPGRFQIIDSERIILDGAHNPAGIKALRESLDHLFPNQHFHFIFACYHDKDGLIMLSNLLKPGDSLYLVNILGKRSSFPLSTLAEHAKMLKTNVSMSTDISQALGAAKYNRKADEYIVGTGSFLLIKALIQYLGWTVVEDGLDLISDGLK